MAKVKKKNRKFVVGEGFLVFAGILLITIGIFFIEKKVSDKDVEKLPKTQLAIKINSYIEFENTSKKGLVDIVNQKENNYDIIVKIQLRDTKEEIYKSKKISPGESISEIKLDKKLEKGKYDAIAYFYAYDEENNYIGKSGAMISLNIKE